MPPLAPPKPPSKAPPKPTVANGTEPKDVKPLAITRGIQIESQKIVLYGPGGVGKSKLASLTAALGVEPLFFDLEHGTKFLDVARKIPESWDELRAGLHDYESMEPFGAVVIDSGTKAEELAIAWTLVNVPKESEKDGSIRYVKSIEGYGWGKGYTYVADTFLTLLGDLDAIARRGKHVVMICHDCTANVPNPEGVDFIRYEPRLQSPPSGKASIRHRVKEWSDHLIYIGFDQLISKDGKATGSGTRTLYTCERPTAWAKSRLLSDPIAYRDGDSTLWQLLLQKEPV
jgi:hypothetical protein